MSKTELMNVEVANFLSKQTALQTFKIWVAFFKKIVT